MEILLLCFMMSWALTRYGITDLVAASKGTESPRVAERRQRAAHAHERAMARTGPTVGEAIAGRIADRISNPPPKKDGTPRKPRGPARQFASQLWADSWAWAAEKDRDRQDRRDGWDTTTGPNSPSGAGPTGPAAGTASVPDPGTSSPGPSGPAAGGTGPASAPRPESAPGPESTSGARPGWHWSRSPQGPGAAPGTGSTRPGPTGPGTSRPSGPSRRRTADGPQVVDAELIDDEPAAPGPGRRQDVVDAEVVDTGETDDDVRPPFVVAPPAALPAAVDRTDHTQDSGAQSTGTQAGDPPWASVTPIRRDIPMTTATHTIGSGETLDPTAAAQFCRENCELAEQMQTSLETSITTLEERGVSGEPIDLLRQMQEAAQVLVGHSQAAQGHFERHMNKQDEIASDDTISRTVEGGYLDAAGR